MVRIREILESPIGYVKESIFFTFVLLWIKLPKFWKTLQLLNPNFLLVIRGFLLTLSYLVNKIDLDSSLSRLALHERDSLVSIPNQPLVEKSVDLVPSLVDNSILEESDDHTAHVLPISSDSHELKSGPPIPVVQESPSPITIEHGGYHMITPPSSSVISFDWSKLTDFCLPSYVPFQIIVQAYNMEIHDTILDEGVFVSIMPSTTWQDLGSPQLVPIT